MRVQLNALRLLLAMTIMACVALMLDPGFAAAAGRSNDRGPEVCDVTSLNTACFVHGDTLDTFAIGQECIGVGCITCARSTETCGLQSGWAWYVE
jgi:hypothetical protein